MTALRPPHAAALPAPSHLRSEPAMTPPQPPASQAATTTPRRRQAGFTLVELLIVVIILGILAAVVVPSFNSTSAEAKEAALVADLNAVRQAISLYRVQHDEVYPGQTDWNELVAQLTETSDQDGNTGAGPYGPYLRTAFPANKVSLIAAGKIQNDMDSGPSQVDTYGYAYDPISGELRANLTGNAPSGIAYWDL